MKIENEFAEVKVVPKFYKMTGHDITLKVADDAPQEVKKWAERLRKDIADGKYNHDLNALYNAMLYRTSVVGV